MNKAAAMNRRQIQVGCVIVIAASALLIALEVWLIREGVLERNAFMTAMFAVQGAIIGICAGSLLVFRRVP